HTYALPYYFLFSLPLSPAHRDLHSFPTRRSSDLLFRVGRAQGELDLALADLRAQPLRHRHAEPRIGRSWMSARPRHFAAYFATRSEEHTSELQSRSDLVCRLLLEKKKKKQHNIYV